MSDNLRDRLLGNRSRDPGCEAGFEVVDEYAEALLQGADVARLFPEIVAHQLNCAACREDIEGLIAALRLRNLPDEPK